MVEYLLRLPDCAVTIVDNASTYPPLLEWYDGDCPVEVLRQRRNGGPRAAEAAARGEAAAGRDYVITDCDLDLSGVPLDVLDVLRGGLDQYPDVCKAGLSLEIEDLPEDGLVSRHVRILESGHWASRRDGQFFDAAIDTTFALRRPGRGACVYGPALRADRPYTARHVPWYISPATLTDEDRYCLAHQDPRYAHGTVYSPLLLERMKAEG